VSNVEGYPSGGGAGFSYYTTCWRALNNSWSWNFNISVTNKGLRSDGGVFNDGPFTSFVCDEFGVYSYAEIVSAGGDVVIQGAPGGSYSTNSSNLFNGGVSQNVSFRLRSNANYSLGVHVDDLLHSAAPGLGFDRSSAPSYLILDNDTIWVRGGTRTSRLNFSDGLSRWWIGLFGDVDVTSGVATVFEVHEVNGSCKFAGEVADDGESSGDLFPNDYNASADLGNGLRAFGGLNDVSHYVEFTCDIPLGAWAGTYSTFVYYYLQNEL
jgi:hypothetical protein